MSRIAILTETVANRIAAGEVVERPVAVIKELVENSLDAGADRIEVEANRGGKGYLRVTDNGTGMSPGEAELCLQRHATSKIREASDLHRITSFGFRGEALPSIASVSDLTLKTRPANAGEGTLLRCEQGRLLGQESAGLPVGTTIEVSRLFQSVPARRKFLKTDATETAHIVQCVRLFALAHPAVGFRLLLDGRETLSTPPCGGPEARIGEIWGRRILDRTLPFARRSGDLHLHGFLGEPPLNRSTRHDLVCIVNGRPVENRTLQYGVLEACTGFLPRGRYPVAFVFLGIDPQAVDVNVHPTKREVRFRDEARVRKLVVETVMDLLLARARSLGDHDLPLTPAEDRREPVRTRPSDPAASQAAEILERQASPADAPVDRPCPPPTDSPASHPPGHAPGDAARPAEGPVSPSGERPDAPAAPARPAAGPALAPAPHRPRSSPGWEWIGPLVDQTVLLRSPRGLVILHPRAARERILYEQFLGEGRNGEDRPVQPLLLPQTFEWDPLPSQCLSENLPVFADHGFTVEAFGRNFFRVHSVPEWFEPGRAEGFLRDAVEGIREGRLRPENVQPFRERLAELAVRHAPRSEGPLSPVAVRELVRQLLTTSVPHSCPAGRPTFVEIEKTELEERFGRSL
mgnify:CR=1 FL=1